MRVETLTGLCTEAPRGHPGGEGLRRGGVQRELGEQPGGVGRPDAETAEIDDGKEAGGGPTRAEARADDAVDVGERRDAVALEGERLA